MIDLDHFKDYNDTYGHLSGDDLLKQMADMLAFRLRSTDFVARYGGEEFCAVIPFTELEAAEVILNELHRRTRELEALRLVTFSSGVAQWDSQETVDELLERADLALYEAKAAGRDQTKLARPTIGRR